MSHIIWASGGVKSKHNFKHLATRGRRIKGYWRRKKSITQVPHDRFLPSWNTFNKKYFQLDTGFHVNFFKLVIKVESRVLNNVLSFEWVFYNIYNCIVLSERRHYNMIVLFFQKDEMSPSSFWKNNTIILYLFSWWEDFKYRVSHLAMI